MPKGAKYVFKVIVVGDGAVGKTSLILQFTENKFTEQYKKTLGTDFAVKKINLGDNDVKLQIWDLGGQEIFRDLRRVFYPGARAALIVFDVTNRKSFENVRSWYKDIREILRDIPIIVVGNKIDLEREVSLEEAKELIRSLGCNYIETSAKYDTNVNEAFINIAKETINYLEGKPYEGGKTKDSIFTPEEIKEEPTITGVGGGDEEAILIPSIFDKPKSPSFEVSRFYEWFENNKTWLNETVDDLLNIITSKKGRLSESDNLTYLLSYFIEQNIKFDIPSEKRDYLIAWTGQGLPRISIIANVINDKTGITLLTALLAFITIKKYSHFLGKVNLIIISRELKHNQKNMKLINKISEITDYALIISDNKIGEIQLTPKVCFSVTPEATITSDTNIVGHNVVNNAIIRLLAHLLEPKLRVFYNIKLPTQKIFVKKIALSNKNNVTASSTIDFYLEDESASAKILDVIVGITNRIKENTPKIKFDIKSSSEILALTDEEAPLLLALRDNIHYILKENIKLESKTLKDDYKALLDIKCPYVMCGFSYTGNKEELNVGYGEILTPAKILSGVVIDLLQ